MRGPEHAAGLVAAALTARLPARLADLEERLELDAGALKVPEHVFASDITRLAIAADFPALLVVAQDGASVGEAEDDYDLDDDDEPAAGAVWLVDYPLRVFIWAAVPDAGAGTPRDRQQLVDLMRKRYTLAVREELLAGLGLAAGAAIRPGFRESYSDVDVDARAKLTLAASYVEVVVRVEERLTRLPAVTYVAGGPRAVFVDVEPLE